MKKNVLIILLAGIISTAAMAQDNKTAKRGREFEKPTPEKMAEMRTNRMKDQLSLSDEQYKKVYDINLEQIKKNQNAAAVRQERAKTEKAELEKKYASVLTPDQMKKFDENASYQPQQNRMRGNRNSRPNTNKKRG